MTEFLDDLKPGPLDQYRRRASFNWKEMAVTIENPVTLRFKHKIWKTLANDPVFARSFGELSFDEYRDITMKRVLKILEYDFLPEDKLIASPNLGIAFDIALQQYDGSVAAKRAIIVNFFPNAIRGLGTAEHYQTLEDAVNGKIFGCVAITEVGHGSNTRGLRTTATYNPSTRQFILNTPDFLAAKCFSGNLGKSATHACVTAKLYTPDGKCHGISNFVVPIRNPKTMLPFPGVSISDLGCKEGLNGLDNGLLIFNNYAISKSGLLNKTGDVSLEGKFLSSKKFTDPTKRFGASLGNLSAARTALIPQMAQVACDSLTIAVRYACVRRQFGEGDDGEELPIMEYQTHQHRLLPYLAAGYVFKYFGESIFDIWADFFMESLSEPGKESAKLKGVEIHVISTVGKAVAGWLARDAIQEARECCGGFGYLKIAGIGTLRNENDANLTQDGDGHILIQQTSNWLLNVWGNKQIVVPTDAPTPLNTLSFLTERHNLQSAKFSAKSINELIDPVQILKMYKWLACKTLETTHAKYSALMKQNQNDAFTSKNESQIYYAKTLSLVFIEHYVLEHFWLKLCSRADVPVNIRAVLQKLMCLYGLWCLEKHISTFYQWGYMSHPRDAELVRESVLHLCKDLKNEAVSLVDAVAPPDFVLNSVLGVSDGEVYTNIQNTLLQHPGAFERYKNWESLSNRFAMSSKL